MDMTESNKLQNNDMIQSSTLKKIGKICIVFGCCIAILLFFFAMPFYIAPGIQNMGSGELKYVATDSTLLSDNAVKKTMSQLRTQVKSLDHRLDLLLPHSPYIVVNTTKNEFHLYNGKGELERVGFCSSGSYTKLVSGDKTWIFKTPKGRMTVLSKTPNPVWSKPDWAFIEEGLPVPKAGDPSRYERGVLGRYALRMADGYLLHGTLYKRFLGMPVTHGCIRLGDDDLEAVYNTLVVGSYVYIY